MPITKEQLDDMQYVLEHDIELLRTALLNLNQCGEVNGSQMRDLYAMIGAEIGLRQYQLDVNARVKLRNES